MPEVREISDSLASGYVRAIFDARRALKRSRSAARRDEEALVDTVLGTLRTICGEKAVERVRSRGVSRAEREKIVEIGDMAIAAADSRNFGPVLEAVAALAPKPRGRKAK